MTLPHLPPEELERLAANYVRAAAGLSPAVIYDPTVLALLQAANPVNAALRAIPGLREALARQQMETLRREREALAEAVEAVEWHRKYDEALVAKERAERERDDARALHDRHCCMEHCEKPWEVTP